MWGKYVVVGLLLVLSIGCTSTYSVSSPPPVASYPPRPDVEVHVFYEELAPYGTWTWLDGYGRVWYPHGVPYGWRPYTVGRWVYTEVGWTWVSDWEWGWAPFHYGRWLHTHTYGWVWVPGTTWAPAWVVWQHGPGWVGWAPLPPTVVWEPHGHLSVVYVERHVHPSWYCFVPERHMLAPHVHRHIVPPSENARLVKVTKNVTHYTTINQRVVNQSVSVERIETVTQQSVPRMRIVETDAPKTHRKAQVKEKEGQVTLFRPSIARVPPETETTKTPGQTVPSVLPQRQPATPPEAPKAAPDTTPARPPAMLGTVPPPRPEASPLAEPPPQPSSGQDESPRPLGRPPVSLKKRPPQTLPQEPAPPSTESPAPAQKPQPVQPPAGQDESPRPLGRPPVSLKQRPPQTLPQEPAPPGTVRQPVPPPRPPATPPPSATQGIMPQPPSPPTSAPVVQPPPPDLRRERRGRRPPQEQQEQEREDTTQGSLSPVPGGAMPPAGAPGAPAGPPSRRPFGGRGQ
jgi:hypothetical protein